MYTTTQVYIHTYTYMSITCTCRSYLSNALTMGGEGQAPGESANRRERSTHTAHAVRAPGGDAAAVASAAPSGMAGLHGRL